MRLGAVVQFRSQNDVFNSSGWLVLSAKCELKMSKIRHLSNCFPYLVLFLRMDLIKSVWFWKQLLNVVSFFILGTGSSISVVGIIGCWFLIWLYFARDTINEG